MMSRAQLKEALIKHIDQADEAFLKMVYAMMEAYAEQQEGITGYRSSGEEIKAEDLKEIAIKGRAEIKKGNFKSLDDLSKESEKWSTDTK